MNEYLKNDNVSENKCSSSQIDSFYTVRINYRHTEVRTKYKI